MKLKGVGRGKQWLETFDQSLVEVAAADEKLIAHLGIRHVFDNVLTHHALEIAVRRGGDRHVTRHGTHLGRLGTQFVDRQAVIPLLLKSSGRQSGSD
jgi:hypothetical protein